MIILNFHGVGPLVREVDAGEHDCWLDTEHFEAILDRIRGNGQVLTTFDDGNLSDYEIALPALLKRGMNAQFFICTGRLGKPTFLDASHLREMHSKGMGIGSHGVNHQPWRKLGLAELREETAGSREILSSICGESIGTAACPFGSYDRRVLKALRGAGYRSVFTSDGGHCAANGWLLARNTMKRSLSMDQLDLILNRSARPSRRLIHGIRTALKRFRPAPSGLD